MKNRRMLLKLFLSYVMLVFPMLGISYFVTNSMISAMRRQVDERILQKSSNFVWQLEEYQVELADRAVMLSAVTELESGKMLGHKKATGEGVTYLKNIKQMDQKLESLMLLYGNNCYTENGYCQLSTYLELQLECSADDLWLAEMMSGQEKSCVLLRGKYEDYLVFHLPIVDKYQNGAASVNFVVGMDEIYSMLESILEQMSVEISISFSNQWQNERIYLQGSMGEGLKEIEEETFEVLQKEKRWVVNSENSEIIGLELVIFYDSGEIYQQVIYWKRINETCMVVLLSVSVLISFRISSNHYKKIYRLKESMSGLISSESEKEEKKGWENDFDTLHFMIQHVGVETGRMKTEIKYIRSVMKQQVAMLLFGGNVREESKIISMLDCCNIELEETFFVVVCIVCQEEGKSLPDFLEKFMKDRLSCMHYIDGRECAVLLFELPNEDFQKKYRDAIAWEILEKAGDACPLKISFSQIYESPTQISRAYQETTRLSRKLLQLSNQTVGYMDMMDESGELLPQFEAGSLEHFERAVMRAEFLSAVNELDVLLEYIQKKNFSEENRQYLRDCVVQSILPALKSREECQDIELQEELADINIEDGELFEERIKEILRKMCQRGEKAQKFQFSKVVDYINSNYSRYDLSLADVAEYAGLSKAYMSRLFKEKTGSKYIEYLTQCRMEHARKLLEETEFSVKKIAGMVGYLNVPGFRNKFKEHYGVNASEYRRLRQEEQCGENVKTDDKF